MLQHLARITLITTPRLALHFLFNRLLLAPSSTLTTADMFKSQTNEPFSSFPPSSSSASSSRVQSPQPPNRYNEHNPSFPLKNRSTHSTTTAYHPYRNAPPSHSSPPKPILFVDATFQPGDSAHSTYSGVGLPQCRPKRKRITTEQLAKLLDVFEGTDNPCFDVREQVGNVSLLSQYSGSKAGQLADNRSLSQEIGMSNREVQVSFRVSLNTHNHS